MRVPSLPVVIDEFPALLDSHLRSRKKWIHGVGPVAGGPEVFFLTHFHTDHMKGLSSTWTAGIIITGTLTRHLLLNKFEGLRGRVLGLPFWSRTPLLAACGAVPSAGGSPTTADFIVYVTLLPAFHIPGSAMIYLETPSGATYLHTGDFKYTEALGDMSPLRTFFESHRVDHLYLDDTWLHLGHVELMSWPACTHRSPSGPHTASVADNGIRVLSKLLDTDQLEEAIEAIGRRMDYQRQLHTHWRKQQQPCEGTGASTELNNSRLPFVVRVYLHNQFGKEMLIQQLAMRLRTKALIDDVRYARLLAVVEVLEEERDDLEAIKGASPAPLNCTVPPLSAEEVAWRASGGEAAYYPYNLNYFVPFSQARHGLLSPLHGRDEQLQRSAHLNPDNTALFAQTPQPTAGHAAKHTCEPPLIEVVSSRASITPAALERASAERAGTPYYGVVISGWARLQSQTRGPAASGQVWHVPTTLHSTPQEIVNFVSLLRPLSATPLHYRPSRGDVVMQRLGPYLRIPFVNHHDTGMDVTAVSTVGSGAIRWMPYLPGDLLSSQLGDSYGQVCLGESPLSAVAGTGEYTAVCGDGLECLAYRPGRGFQIGPTKPPCRGAAAAARLGGGERMCRQLPDDANSTRYFLTSSSESTISFSSKDVPRACCAQGHSAGTFVASSTPEDQLSVPQLLPTWKLRHLTQSYLNTQQSGCKRVRVVDMADDSIGVPYGAKRSAPTVMGTCACENGVEVAGGNHADCAVMSLKCSDTPDRHRSLSDIVNDLLE